MHQVFLLGAGRGSEQSMKRFFNFSVELLKIVVTKGRGMQYLFEISKKRAIRRGMGYGRS